MSFITESQIIAQELAEIEYHHATMRPLTPLERQWISDYMDHFAPCLESMAQTEKE